MAYSRPTPTLLPLSSICATVHSPPQMPTETLSTHRSSQATDYQESVQVPVVSDIIRHEGDMISQTTHVMGVFVQ